MSNSAFELLHPGVQRAIYEMGWTSLRPIQASAIRSILGSEKHLLICAQTAGGKTEAAFLPIISRMAGKMDPSVQTIYIGPLKALINDQFRRLETLCSHLEIPVHSWHGDISADRKRKFREKPGGILLITPESLESNFINYSTEIARLYQHLRFIVIDEVHSFLDNVRGVHLRSLLARLQAITEVSPRVIGLSATLGDPIEARRFINFDEPDTVEIIEDSSEARTIRFGIRGLLSGECADDGLIERYTPAEAALLQEALLTSQPTFEMKVEEIRAVKQWDSGDELDDIADDLVRTCSNSTNLVFVNARQRIELLADRLHKRAEELGWKVDPFEVHHSSVSKDLREDAEARLKSGQPTTVICSSTLELGIDVGSVRAVGQVDPPWSVSSALQRLGRSGRRDGEAAIMRLYSTDDPPAVSSAVAQLLYPNLLRSIAIARLMFVEKWLEPVDLDKMHLSTLVHQILSCLKQTGGMNAANLFTLLVQRGPFRIITKADFIELLRGLAQHEIIEQMPQGDLILAPEGERITSRHDFYAAFTGTDELVVRHNHRQIGKIPADSVPASGEHMLLGGRRWQVEEIDWRGKQVFVVPARGRKDLRFTSSIGEIHTRVISEMRRVLLDKEEPGYLDEAGRLMLRTARETSARTRVLSENVVRGEQSVEWFPWIGTRGQRALLIYARQLGIRCSSKYLLSIQYEMTYGEFCSHLEKLLGQEIDLEQLADFRLEKFDDFVPDTLLKRAFVLDRVDATEAKAAAERFLRSTDGVAKST